MAKRAQASPAPGAVRTTKGSARRGSDSDARAGSGSGVIGDQVQAVVLVAKIPADPAVTGRTLPGRGTKSSAGPATGHARWPHTTGCGRSWAATPDSDEPASATSKRASSQARSQVARSISRRFKHRAPEPLGVEVLYIFIRPHCTKWIITSLSDRQISARTVSP